MAVYSSTIKHIENDIEKCERILKYRFFKENLSANESASTPWKNIDASADWKDAKIQIVKDLIAVCGIESVILTKWYTRGKSYPQLIEQSAYDAMPSNIQNAGRRRYREIGTFENGKTYYLHIFAGSGELVRKIITLANDLGYVIEFEC